MFIKVLCSCAVRVINSDWQRPSEALNVLHSYSALSLPTTFLAASCAACKHGRFMSESEYVSKTWHSLCTPRSERLHFLISKPDTLDSWPLTPHFTWVAGRPHSPFSGSCGVAGVTVDTAVLCYAELWEPPHISTTPSLRKSVSNQMDCTAECVWMCVWMCRCVSFSSAGASSNYNDYSPGTVWMFVHESVCVSSFSRLHMRNVLHSKYWFFSSRKYLYEYKH